MVPGNRVRNDLRNHSIVGAFRRSNDLLRARRRVIDPIPGAIETTLKFGRVFAQVVQQSRERRGVRRPKLCAARPRRLRNRTQMLGQRLPMLLPAFLQRVRVKDAMTFDQWWPA